MPVKAERLQQKQKNTHPIMNVKEQFLTHIELIAAILSGVIILTAWSLTSIIPYAVWVTMHIVAFLIGGYAQAKEGILDTIETKKLNVELLMVIAAIGSALIGFWTEGAILIFIFALAGALETYTMNKSNAEISSLMELQPEEARIMVNGRERFTAVEDLQIGQRIFILAGERIPADGTIVHGVTAVDESPITGESIPVNKGVSEEVFAGTVALNGSIEVEITKRSDETIFQKIIDMIQLAKDEKSPAQLFIERFESTYVYTVLTIVVIMMFLPYLLFDWTLTESIYRAIVLLVVASPCALVASIMPATLSAISKSARNGVLFKGGIHLENLSDMKMFAFDKTGTLTKGTPEVTDVLLHPDYDEAYIHEVVGAIESESTHPLAIALRDFALNVLNKEQFDVKVEHVETVSGKGVIGTVNNKQWYVGKEYFATDSKEVSFYEQKAAQLANEGKTVVYVGYEDKIIAVYALKDTVREEAKQAIELIHQLGMKTIMLTGDNELTAKAVAEEVGIETYVAECLPDEKVNYIRSLRKKHGKVAMVGDGINDAPALTLADIGIAMGEGTHIAIETADMILMKNDLSKITASMQTSKKMNRVIKQNIFFSIAVIIVLVISNFFQAIDLPLGVIGHEGSTILVILNGLRLLR